MPVVQCRNQQLDLSQVAIMGILNVTPDSFSDGGLWLNPDKAIEHAKYMHEQGAAIIDIGGESTRPGAEPISTDEQCQRVIPVIEALAKHLPEAILSIDTSDAEVMRAAATAGVHLINDVNALRADGAVQVAAESDCAVCIMHMQGQPRSMQQHPTYTDVVTEVSDFLEQRVEACLAAGIRPEKIIIDPGFGFGKSLQHNLDLLKNLTQLNVSEYPVLVGLSRKSMFTKLVPALSDQAAAARVYASTAATVVAVQNGASIIRTHDIAATRDALAVLAAL